MMQWMQDVSLWKMIFTISAIVGGAFLLAGIAVFIVHHKKKEKNPAQEASAEPNGELLKVAEKDVVKPILPKSFSLFGIFCFFFVFGVSGLGIFSGGLAVSAVALISFFLGVAGEVAASMVQYALHLRYNDDVIFVPQSIGLIGTVVRDIPAGQKGQGSIRVRMKGCVTAMNAMSVDEVVLTKGTDVKILYADSDKVVVVERYVKGKPSELSAPE